MIGLQPSGMWTRQTEIHSRPVKAGACFSSETSALQPPVAPRRPLVVNRRAPTKQPDRSAELNEAASRRRDAQRCSSRKAADAK